MNHKKRKNIKTRGYNKEKKTKEIQMRWVLFICWRDDEKQAGATVLVSVHEREVERERGRERECVCA